MRSHLRTPLIVDVNMDPDDYIKGLTKSARKNHSAAMKNNYKFNFVEYNPKLVVDFMQLWSSQIGGNWGFGEDYFRSLSDKCCLDLFAGSYKGKIIAILPMECFAHFMYAQPVMYDKKLYPNAAKFMWFSMLKEACFDWNVSKVDLGGGFNGSWDQFIQTRGGPSFKYKWRFVAQAVKENPDSQRPWFVQRCKCGWKFLTLAPQPCPQCGDVPCRMYG